MFQRIFLTCRKHETREKMALGIFVSHVFAIFTTNALFLRVRTPSIVSIKINIIVLSYYRIIEIR